MKRNLTGLVAGLAAAAVIAFSPAAQAEYPEGPVSFVVPFPPGDLEDVLTRLIADEFQEMYDVPAAVVNKPGGGGGPFPGAAEVAAAPADGSMIGSFVIAVPVVGPVVGVPGMEEGTFDPVGIFLTYPFVIAAGKDAPYSTMKELAAHAKENPVALGHFGGPLVPTRVARAVAKKEGFDYGSDAAFDELTCNTLASGDVDVMTTTIQQILACLDDVNILLTVTEAPISSVPDAPVLAEDYPDLALSLWNGLFVKAGTPDDVKEKITAAAVAALKSEEAKKVAEATGAIIYWDDPEKSAERIKKDQETFRTIGSMLQ